MRLNQFRYNDKKFYYPFILWQKNLLSFLAIGGENKWIIKKLNTMDILYLQQNCKTI
jgi:hypothetical protein